MMILIIPPIPSASYFTPGSVITSMFFTELAGMLFNTTDGLLLNKFDGLPFM